MKNWVNWIIKFVITTAILLLLIPMFGRGTWTQTIILSLVLTVLSYVVGDLWVLPKFGSFWAVVVEFFLTALVVGVMAVALPQFRVNMTGLWIIAFIIGVGEWMFHNYLQTTGAKEEEDDRDKIENH